MTPSCHHSPAAPGGRRDHVDGNRVVDEVRRHIEATIDHHGAYLTSGDLAAFVCR
jgi:hypothetical protein